MKMPRRILAILTAGLTVPWLLVGCEEPDVSKDFAAQTIETVIPQTITDLSAEENPAGPEPVFTDIQENQLDAEKDLLQRYSDYTLVFSPDDFAPEEILCDNVFSTYQDGRKNPELMDIYEKVKEEWEYLYYVRYDIDGDGEEPDYIVLHCNPDEDAEGETKICGGDIWYRGTTNDQKVTWLRQKLPDTSYLIGGTWEEPKLYMMLMTQAHNYLMQRDFAVYRDYESSELILYGRDDLVYERVKAYFVEEEVAGFKIRLTAYQTLNGDQLFLWDAGSTGTYKRGKWSRFLSGNFGGSYKPGVDARGNKLYSLGWQ